MFCWVRLDAGAVRVFFFTLCLRILCFHCSGHGIKLAPFYGVFSDAQSQIGSVICYSFLGAGLCWRCVFVFFGVPLC